MAYTVTELITGAYNVAGIVSADFQEVSSAQFTRGLRQLNALLSRMSTSQTYIPYFIQHDIVPEPGVPEYVVSNLVEVENAVYFLNGSNDAVRYPMIEQSRNQFFGSMRAMDVEGMPFLYRIERQKGGATLYIWLKPQYQVSLIRLWAKFSLTNVAPGDDLSLVYDDFYIDFLKYYLAKYLCAENTFPFKQEAREILDSYFETMINISPVDYSYRIISYSNIYPYAFGSWAAFNNGWGNLW